MNINNILLTMKNIASDLKTVHSAYTEDVYTIWNTAEVKYGSFVANIKNVRRIDNLRSYNIILYYGDRLLQDGSNRLGIWDDATNTLQAVINAIEDLEEVNSVGEYTIELFEQKFSDMLAGGYVQLDIEVVDQLGQCFDEFVRETPELPDPFDPFQPIDPGDWNFPDPHHPGVPINP